MDVSKFNILGEEIDIKDKFLRDKITGLDLKSLAVIGDSNAEGYGWWKGDRSKKTNQNDGYCAVLRELYPNAVIDNYSVSGATLSVSGNYLLPQLENLLNSSKQYQHIIIQAGFNDIVQKINGNENFIGITPYSRNSCLEKNSYTNCSDAFCSYVSKIKQGLPEAKIHFLMRESQYKNDSIEQLAYIDLHTQIARACEIIGVDFIDCAYDGITSNLTNISNIYFYDSIHWNEKAFRDIITPFIISHFIGNNFGSFNNSDEIMVINSIGQEELFNNDVTISEGIQKFIDILPTIYSFSGQLVLAPSRFSYSAIIIKNSFYFNAVFYRNNSNEKCEICDKPFIYKKVTRNGFFNRDTSDDLFTSLYDGFTYNYNNKVTFPSYTYGISKTVNTHSGNILKEYRDVSGASFHGLINPANGELKNYWLNGGMILSNIDLANNNHLKNGLYFVPNDVVGSVLSKPENINGGFCLIVCMHPNTTYGYMMIFNRNGIWVSDNSANWNKLI